MERLTKKEKLKLSHGEELIMCKHDVSDCNDSCMSMQPCKWYKKVQEKLWEYEDAEEQGLLLRLPCKVGGKVYVIAPNYNKCENHYECEEYDSEQYLITWCQANCPKGFKGIGVVETKVVEIKIREGDIYLQTDRCGLRNTKNMFLTKEEAEQALAEMEGV